MIIITVDTLPSVKLNQDQKYKRIEESYLMLVCF